MTAESKRQWAVADFHFEVDEKFTVNCSCGKGATAALVSVTHDHPSVKTVRWFRGPEGWWVHVGEGPVLNLLPISPVYVRCPECMRTSPPPPTIG